jgi:hypothetical protein
LKKRRKKIRNCETSHESLLNPHGKNLSAHTKKPEFSDMYQTHIFFGSQARHKERRKKQGREEKDDEIQTVSDVYYFIFMLMLPLTAFISGLLEA